MSTTVERQPQSRTWRPSRGTMLVGLSALVVAASAIRAATLDQSLYGDELFALHEVDRGSPFDVLRVIDEGPEVTPPLFFLLAWAAGKLGDPTVWIRVPSLLAGVALIPVVFALGSRTIGRVGAVLAAVLVAFAPYFLFYSSEARPYMLMALLVTASALCLVRAVDDGGRGWWVAHVLATAGAMYTHLSCVFVLAGQFAWALAAHPSRRRDVLMATGAAAVLFLPWLPNISGKGNLLIYNIFFERPTSVLFKVFPGEPFVPLQNLPGRFAIALCWFVVVAALGWSVARAVRGRSASRRGAVLVAVLALATPVGMGAAAIISGYGLFTPRNLMASAPAMMLLIGWAVGHLPRRAGAVAAAVLVAIVVLGAVQHLDPDSQRPAFRALADDVRARMEPGDVVFDATPHPDEAALQPVAIYFERPETVVRPATEARAWSANRIFYVVARVGAFGTIPRALGPAGRYRLTRVTRYRGFERLALAEYENGG